MPVVEVNQVDSFEIRGEIAFGENAHVCGFIKPCVLSNHVFSKQRVHAPRLIRRTTSS